MHFRKLLWIALILFSNPSSLQMQGHGDSQGRPSQPGQERLFESITLRGLLYALEKTL